MRKRTKATTKVKERGSKTRGKKKAVVQNSRKDNASIVEGREVKSA